jgi:hemerythrin-like metal-binding protein
VAEFYTWDPKLLSVHVTEMDNEHMMLIKKMNALHEAYSQKKDRAGLTPLVNDFVAFTLKHFSDEEAYMERVKFEGIATHKIIHQQLLTEVKKYVAEFESSGKLSDPFFKFLAVWLTSHIRGIDSKYGPAH